MIRFSMGLQDQVNGFNCWINLKNNGLGIREGGYCI